VGEEASVSADCSLAADWASLSELTGVVQLVKKSSTRAAERKKNAAENAAAP